MSEARTLENIPEFYEPRFWTAHTAAGFGVFYRLQGRTLGVGCVQNVDKVVARSVASALNAVVADELEAALAAVSPAEPALRCHDCGQPATVEMAMGYGYCAACASARRAQDPSVAAEPAPPEIPVDHRCPEIGRNTLQGAFVSGAKWWEFTSTGGTMWASDRDKAWAEAEKRYPAGEPAPALKNVEDALHAVFTQHGIASRSDYPFALISDLIGWAAEMCRQSHAAVSPANPVTLYETASPADRRIVDKFMERVAVVQLKAKAIGGGAKPSTEDDSQRLWTCGCYEDQGGYHLCLQHSRAMAGEPAPAPALPIGIHERESAVRGEVGIVPDVPANSAPAPAQRPAPRSFVCDACGEPIEVGPGLVTYHSHDDPAAKVAQAEDERADARRQLAEAEAQLNSLLARSRKHLIVRAEQAEARARQLGESLVEWDRQVIALHEAQAKLEWWDKRGAWYQRQLTERDAQLGALREALTQIVKRGARQPDLKLIEIAEAALAAGGPEPQEPSQ